MVLKYNLDRIVDGFAGAFNISTPLASIGVVDNIRTGFINRGFDAVTLYFIEACLFGNFINKIADFFEVFETGREN
jgi:hypothetical protein